MESTDRQELKRIARLEKLTHSNRGNPRYRVDFTDETSAETNPDSFIAFTIGNSEHREGDVLVTFNYRGKITDVRPADS